MTQEQIKTYATIWWMIVFGAIANAFQLFLKNAEDQKENNLIEFFWNLFIAWFGWLIACLAAQMVTDNFIFTAVAWGIGWYTWVKGLNKIKDVIFESLINILKK